MIKFHITRKKKIKLTIDGTPDDLWKETAIFVSQVYKAIKKKYPDSAETYKITLLGVLIAPDSPVWKENNDGK